MSALIRFEGVSLGYEDETVLAGVDCAVEPGEFVGLVGPNGAGKTTFLRAVLGLIKPASGRVKVDRSRRFAYVPQAEELNLYWPITVREAVYLAARSRRAFGRLGRQARATAEDALERAGIASIGDKLLREVSGGQRQRAVLAQALSQRPDVLLLDEPTRGLDVVAETQLLELVRGLRAAEGMTILLVTHTLHIPMNYASKILLFELGRMLQATPEELVATRKLEELYGVPFVHHEADGVRWVAPRKAAK